VAGPLPIGDKWPIDNRLVSKRAADTFHVYIHIPYCTVRCGYCDFNTYTQQEIAGVSMQQFHIPLVQEIGFSRKVLAESEIKPRKVSSVFFGGGTPSLFSSEQIASILSALAENFGLEPNCEITLEANPESASDEFLSGIREAGVNRISVGVQSFDPEVLKVLDRQHSPESVARVVAKAKELGFKVSVDLIYGSPLESLASWQQTVKRALELQTDHISSYSLIVEEGTKLARQIARGDLPQTNEDVNAEMYEYAAGQFESAGLSWYEVSNFGQVAKHNLAYWQSQDWWGYGPGAHSHIGGNRFWNTKHPARYVEQLNAGSPAAGIEHLSLRQMLEEELMLGLRTRFGVERSLLSRLQIPAQKVASQLSAGTLSLQGDRVVPTESGRLLIDRLVVDFLQ
jgi:oxygen-independent coproporphyrinogen-3 oxidase